MGQKANIRTDDTAAHESEAVSYRLRMYVLVRKMLIGFIAISLFNVVFSYMFYTPKMYRINRDNRELVLKYGIMRDKIRVAERKLEEIKHRDNFVYRALFSSDTVAVRAEPYPESKYASLRGDEYTTLMTDTWRDMDALAQQIYLESVSFDEL